jgi:O-antigen ligase
MMIVKTSLIPPALNKNFYYAIMAIMSLQVIFNIKKLKSTPIIVTFICLLSFIIFLFNLPYTADAGLYLIARVSTLLYIIILLKTISYRSLIKVHKFIYYLVYIVLLISVLNPSVLSESDGRYAGIFNNVNDFGTIGVIGTIYAVSGVVRSRILNRSLLLLCAVTVLLSASRASFLGFLVAILFFEIRVSYKIFLIIMGTLLVLFTNPDLLIIDRFQSPSLVSNREGEWSVAIELIKQKPWFGHGLSAYDGMVNNSDLYEINRVLGAHNGYLTLFLTYGIPAGLVLIIIGMISVYKSRSDKIKAHAYRHLDALNFEGIVTIAVLGFAESIFTGVNDLSSILFWFMMVGFVTSK